ncbi:MAG: outer membrane beta-barrel domain-containing protein [Desulfatibacillum sp.]|nr:outer membrane beta-barrel domain-containing protein [Desulfatibacillum sp.]
MFDCPECLDNDWYFGLRGGYNFTEHWGIEGLLGYVPAESNAHSYDGQDVDVYRYGLEGLYHFMPKSKFVPFVAVGIGGKRVDGPSGYDDDNRGMFDYGVGFKYFASKNVALRADVRHDLYYESDDLDNNLEYTAGLTILFGGAKKMAAAAAPPPRIVETVPVHVPAPAPAPVPAPISEPTPKVVLVEFTDTHFEFNKSALTPQGKEVLAENIRTLKANPDMNILVAGYTSASGSEEYNQKLSERRATTVRDALVEGGIAPERLTRIGYGERMPATYEPFPKDLESKAAKSNMRVLFTIIVKEGTK